MNSDRHLTIYRALTSTYPNTFRREYREDLVTMFAHQLDEEPALRVWMRTLKDLAVTVPSYQLEAKMKRPSNQLLSGSLFAIAAALAVTALLIGTGVRAVSLGLLVVAILSTVLAFWIWTTEQPFRENNSANSWWKWMLAGIGVIATTFAAMEVPWPNSIDLGDNAYWVVVGSVMSGIGLATFGLVIGLASLVHRQRGRASAH